MNKFKKRFQQTLILLISLLLQVGFINCSPQNFKSQLNQFPQSNNSSLATSSDLTVVNPPVVVPPVVVVPPPVSVGKVQIFLAAGKMGRTVMSCDDGLTWINDHSDNDNARCWVDGDPNYVECDHSAASFTGLDTSADGWLYTQYGWGYDGTIRRSRNGNSWETVRTGGWGGGLAVSNNKVVQLWESGWSISSNQGQAWQAIPNGNYSNFDHAFIYRAKEKLFVVGRQNGELAVSQNSGLTWSVVPSFQDGWGNNSFAEGNGVIVSIGERSVQGSPTLGFAARSVDNGLTWKAVQVFQNQSWSSEIIFNGTYFVAWSNGRKYQSTDGAAWTSVVSSWGEGNIAYNANTQTYVGISDSWGNYYDKQKAYRSKDGITWTKLDTAHFRGGHPIGKTILAEVDASACGK